MVESNKTCNYQTVLWYLPFEAGRRPTISELNIHKERTVQMILDSLLCDIVCSFNICYWDKISRMLKFINIIPCGCFQLFLIFPSHTPYTISVQISFCGKYTSFNSKIKRQNFFPNYLESDFKSYKLRS